MGEGRRRGERREEERREGGGQKERGKEKRGGEKGGRYLTSKRTFRSQRLRPHDLAPVPDYSSVQCFLPILFWAYC